jgi:hypothetical protein
LVSSVGFPNFFPVRRLPLIFFPSSYSSGCASLFCRLDRGS